MIIALTIALAIALLAAVGGVGFAAWTTVRATKMASDVFQQSVALNRSHDETLAKSNTLIMNTASTLSQIVDERVARRVGQINAFVSTARGETPASTEPVGEMPPMATSTFIDDDHEINRERGRFRREGATPVREPGVGQEIPAPPPVNTEAL